jgi:hypothetical protein
VRQSCASQTGNNRIQPDKTPHGQAKSAFQWAGPAMWIIVYTTVYIL